MAARRRIGSVGFLALAALSLGIVACGDDTGFEDCVAACEQQLQCVGAPEPGGTNNSCERSCEAQEEAADDVDCDDEWADTQRCMRESEACDYTSCMDRMIDYSECVHAYCRDNPNDPECQVDSAPSSAS